MKCPRCSKNVEKLVKKLCIGKQGFRTYEICEKCKQEIERKESEEK